ncbi:hypothetical protein [Streptomyces sp. NPDC093089]|uniref:hypothetical protein n=1 Tax=Streptomyces sp. NPDC093089 TaxID=3366024 RepID=UPI003827B00F
MTVGIRIEARGGRRIGLAVATAMTAVLGSVAGAAPASAAAPVPGPILDVTETAHAQVNECYAGIGLHTAPNPDGTCPTGYQQKIDGGYVWAAARSGDHGYFGTLANVLCGGISTFTADVPAAHEVPGVNSCEYSQSSGAATFGPRIGDSRTPQVLRVNADSQKVEDISPEDDPLFQNTTGLRGAAANGDIVFMMGLKQPTALDARQGVSLFAFEGRTGRYLGSQLRTDLVTGRGGVQGPDGGLYLAGRTANSTGGASGLGGSILKWTGSLEDPFQFEKVGDLPNDAGYITVVGNRLAVSGWMGVLPSKKSASYGGPSKIWMSPEIGEGGLTTADAADWKSLFSWDDYDPDPVVGKSIVWGGIKEWRGDLYVGSYNYAGMTSVTSLWNEYGEPTSEATRLRDVAKANRAATIFKISDPGTSKQKVTLLYGESALPVYDPASKTWSTKPNKLGQTPKFGPSGFGNPANMYSWTFTTFQDKLYMSTADATGLMIPSAFTTQYSYGTSDATATALEKVVGPALFKTMGGGDVYRMDDPDKPAVAETLNGFGNRTQHGVRVFLPFEDKGFLWAGMAGSYNLKTTDKDRGGWSLDKLTPGAMRSPLTNYISPDAGKAVLGGVGLGMGL